MHISYREPFGETIRVPEDDEQFKLAEDEFIQAASRVRSLRGTKGVPRKGVRTSVNMRF